MGHKNIRKQDPVRHYRETFSVCRSTPVSCGQNERYVSFIFSLQFFGILPFTKGIFYPEIN